MSAAGYRPLAVVTGASGGIGRAIALRLHGAGYAIVAHYASRTERALALKVEIEGAGGYCSLAQADLSTAHGISSAIEAVDDVLDMNQGFALRALVNNAAHLLGPSFETATIEQFDSFFALNTRAPFFLTQALARRMASGASIVNISSAGAHFSSPSDIVYAMSKAALESLTANAAESLASLNVRINTVVPGFTDNGHDAFQDPDVLSYLSSFSVLGGVASPSAVAEAVYFLLSEGAGRTTGTTLDVSGGSTLGARPPSPISLKDVARARRGSAQST